MIGSQVFFIVGLPRSRTAWLANFLTWGEMFCHHDLWARAATIEDFRKAIDETPTRAVGNADPTNALHHEALTQEYPDAKWIIVNRPIAEAHTSCVRVGRANMETLQMVARKIEELRGRVPGAIEVDFLALNGTLAAHLGEQILPEWRCPRARREMLTDLNVQVHALTALAKLATLQPGDVCAPEPLELSALNRCYLDEVRAMCGQQHKAMEWFLCVLELATVWDHCVDGDGVSPAMADRVFTAVTTEWPFNEWWAANRYALVPALVAARSAWRWSNNPAAPKFKAYDLYTELPAVMAWLIGGNALVEQALPGIRECAFALLAEDERRDGGKK